MPAKPSWQMYHFSDRVYCYNDVGGNAIFGIIFVAIIAVCPFSVCVM